MAEAPEGPAVKKQKIEPTNVAETQKYWQTFYDEHKAPENPSPFANFVFKKFLPLVASSHKFCELGCGNGRDARWFASKDWNVTAVDVAVDPQVKASHDAGILKFVNKSMAQLNDTETGHHDKYDVIYSRFSLHAVSKETASKALEWASNALNAGPKAALFIEARSIKDDLFGKGTSTSDKNAWVTDHYRRFIVLDELISELESRGFVIDYKIESKGLAVYKEEDPMIVRVVAHLPTLNVNDKKRKHSAEDAADEQSET